MKTLTHKEWIDRAISLFGKDAKQWKFKCVQCGGVQCMQDFIDNGVDSPDTKVFFSCIGRWVPSRGCNWTLGGLFTIHTTEVVSDGNEKPTPVFEFAEINPVPA